MTEYTKLVGSLGEITTAIDTLYVWLDDVHSQSSAIEYSKASRTDDTNVTSLHATAESVKSSLAVQVPRLRKLVHRARETDPDKQLYNEMMCGKIETLLCAYKTQIMRLLRDKKGVYPYHTDSDAADDDSNNNSGVKSNGGATTGSTSMNENQVQAETHNSRTGANGANDDVELWLLGNEPRAPLLEQSYVLQEVHKQYGLYLLHRSETEAWEARVARGIADVVQFENETRMVFQTREQVELNAVKSNATAEKTLVQRLLRERAEAKWVLEQARRQAEHTRLRAGCALLRANGGVCQFIEAQLPSDGHGRVRHEFVTHMHTLIQSLLRAPDDDKIRRIRSNNLDVLHDYGHPCLSMSSVDHMGAAASRSACVCATVNATAEQLLYHVGYVVTYIGHAVPTLTYMVDEKVIRDAILPCGELISQHTYTKLGFEDYAERCLELQEPDMTDTSQADAWMAWYETLKQTEMELATCVNT